MNHSPICDRDRNVHPMTRLLESSRFVALIGIFSLIVLAITCFAWGALKAANAVMLIVLSLGRDPDIAVALIGVVDVFLIATVLFVVGVSLYEMFIGDLHVPEWMVAHNLYELKSKLSGVIILVMAMKFLEKLWDWKAPQDTLYFALAISVVSAVLVAMSYLNKGKD
jgi:uncharacterized membrane protein YqhA